VSRLSELKARLRHDVLAQRTTVPAEQRGSDGRSLAERVLQLPELQHPTTVAAYLSFGSEPATGPLVDALAERGHRVLVPELLPDHRLDWRQVGSDVRLGVDAVGQARVVVCPGLAADRNGMRLGRGGGSYDRALAHCDPAALRVLLLHDDELVESVPVEPHDEHIDVVITPSRTLRLR